MFANRFTRRIAATTLAAALTLGGFAGIGAAATPDDHGDAPTEQAGSTWSFAGGGFGGGKGGATTQGSTWS